MLFSEPRSMRPLLINESALLAAVGRTGDRTRPPVSMLPTCRRVPVLTSGAVLQRDGTAPPHSLNDHHSKAFGAVYSKGESWPSSFLRIVHICPQSRPAAQSGTVRFFCPFRGEFRCC